MPIAQAIKEVNNSFKEYFGNDFSISVARCPAFGHDDTCLLIYGINHEKAAAMVVTLTKDTIVKTEKRSKFEDSEPDVFYSVVTF